MAHYDSSETLIRVGHKIRILRERAGVTQAELAKKLRTRKEVVSRIEEGRHNLLLSTLFEIAHIFGRRLKITFVKRKGGV